jgi:hypothetical protein
MNTSRAVTPVHASCSASHRVLARGAPSTLSVTVITALSSRNNHDAHGLPASSGMAARETGMKLRLREMLLGCRHRHLSFPITIRAGGHRSAHKVGPYVVCLDCAKKFSYDWEEMRLGEAQTENKSWRESHRRAPAESHSLS